VSGARATIGALAAAAVLLAPAGCVRGARPPDVTASRPGTPVDSATVALWRMDETGGTHVADAGTSRLDATAGPDTRTDFGRFRSTRIFTRSADSFLYVPYSPLLDVQSALSVEAWISPNSFANLPSPIAARWSPTTGDRSWVFALGSSGLAITTPDPGWLSEIYTARYQAQRLAFLFQPEDAGASRVFLSQSIIATGRWTHVAVTFDGDVVRFYVNGQPDGSFATTGRIRASQAPLLVGNFFDTRFLTDFGGDLRQGPAADAGTSYAFDGGIDELRISNVARTVFPLHGGR